MPEIGGRHRGDLFATVQVHTPKKISKEQRHLLEPEVTLVRGPSDTAPNLLKTIAPLIHAADSAVLIDAEDSDGRPILFERHKACPRVVSILGAKLDNIYDVLGFIEAQSWDF